MSKRIEGVLFIRELPDGTGQCTYWCPGCDGGHTIHYGGAETWTWDGNAEKPTFSPSVLANGLRGIASEEWLKRHPRCHAFVRAGKIYYLSDCEHSLANQEVDMVPLPEKYHNFLY